MIKRRRRRRTRSSYWFYYGLKLQNWCRDGSLTDNCSEFWRFCGFLSDKAAEGRFEARMSLMILMILMMMRMRMRTIGPLGPTGTIGTIGLITMAMATIVRTRNYIFECLLVALKMRHAPALLESRNSIAITSKATGKNSCWPISQIETTVMTFF